MFSIKTKIFNSGKNKRIKVSSKIISKNEVILWISVTTIIHINTNIVYFVISDSLFAKYRFLSLTNSRFWSAPLQTIKTVRTPFPTIHCFVVFQTGLRNTKFPSAPALVGTLHPPLSRDTFVMAHMRHRSKRLIRIHRTPVDLRCAASTWIIWNMLNGAFVSRGPARWCQCRAWYSGPAAAAQFQWCDAIWVAWPEFKYLNFGRVNQSGTFSVTQTAGRTYIQYGGSSMGPATDCLRCCEGGCVLDGLSQGPWTWSAWARYSNPQKERANAAWGGSLLRSPELCNIFLIFIETVIKKVS